MITMRMDTHNKKTTLSITGIIVSTLTAMVGNTIHQSVFWTVMDFLFAPLPWLKWLIFQEVNLTILKETFSWFLK